MNNPKLAQAISCTVSDVFLGRGYRNVVTTAPGPEIVPSPVCNLADFAALPPVMFDDETTRKFNEE